jgi:catechol 2,3-dioxygenase-like lactoylglutathione lyase family enzyme
MSLSLDHIVILVEELEAAIADYRALGFTVQRGGTHADGATHNALVGFADGSYLEIIAFLRRAPEHRWWRYAEKSHQGYVDFALLPHDTGEVVRAAQARGLAYQGPIEGGRVRLDGQRLVWQTGTPPTVELPFLCGDVTPRALRVVEGDVRVHPNGVTGVASLSVVVRDLEASLARYAALLGPQVAQGVRPVAVAGLGQRQALLPLGPTTLVLVEAGPDAAESSPLRQMLQTRGEGVLGLALAGVAGTAVKALPRGQTHGAAFDIVPG